MFRNVVVALLLVFVLAALAQEPSPADLHPEIPRISVPELADAVNGTRAPLVLHVGRARLYRYAHIRGSEYAGPAAESDGLAALRKRVQSLPKSTSIVIYCGCCPWEHCPNIKPAFDELRNLGFTNVKALYLPNNFKFDWEDKGYPTEKGS